MTTDEPVRSSTLPTSTSAGSPLVWILACIAREDDLAGWSDDGIEADLPARVLSGPPSAHGLAAVVCPVKEVDYVGVRSEERFNDAAWVAERSIRHDDVISSAATRGPVFPVAFGSAFRTEAALLDQLVHLTPQVEERLPGFQGRMEVAVTVLADERVISERLAAARATEAAAESDSGLGYLRRRKAVRTAAVDVRPWALERAEEIRSKLDAVSAAMIDRKIVTANTEDGLVVAKWAMLTDVENEHAIDSMIDAATEDLGPDSITISVTGPWPPYSYATDSAPVVPARSAAGIRS